MLLTPVSWPGEFQGLSGPWGHKESDTTEQLSLNHSYSNLEFGVKIGTEEFVK